MGALKGGMSSTRGRRPALGRRDPRRAAMVRVMMDHYKYEVLGQPDGVMKTLVPDPHYRFYGLSSGIVELHGLTEVRSFYEELAASGANVLQFDVDYLLIDDTCISGFGAWHQVYRGETVMAEGGLVSTSKITDPDGRYLIKQTMAWFFPYNSDEDPKLLGEIVFFNSEPLSVRKLDEGEEVFAPITEDDFVV
jgi:hypothetical protein